MAITAKDGYSVRADGKGVYKTGTVDPSTPTSTNLTDDEQALLDAGYNDRVAATNPNNTTALNTTVDVPDTVTSESLTDETPIVPNEPAPTTGVPTMQEFMEMYQSMLDSEPKSETAQEADALRDDLKALFEERAGEAEFRREKEQEFGLEEQKQIAKDYTSQLKALIAEEKTIPINIQEDFTGRGVTTGGIAPIEMSRLRQNAIRQVGVGIAAEAAFGNLATTQELIDSAVSAKFDPVHAQIDAKLANLELITPLLTAEENKRAEARKFALEEYRSAVEKQEEDDRNKWELSAIVSMNTKNPSLARKIQNAGSYEEALQIAIDNNALMSEEEKANDFQFINLRNRTVVYDPATDTIVREFANPEPVDSGGGGTGGGFIFGGGEPIVDPETGEVHEYGTPEYMVARLKATAGAKTKATKDERVTLGKFGSVIAQTSNLVETLNNEDIDTGPIIGALKKINPYDFDARTVNAQINALVPNVARAVYGEVGVLTDQDIERYLLTLPNLVSTEQQNQFVALMTLENAFRSYEQTLLNMANSQVDVSGFVDTYLNVQAEIDRIKADLNMGAIDNFTTALGITAEDESIFDKTISNSDTDSGGGFFSNLLKGLFD